MLAYGYDVDYEQIAKAREMFVELGDYSDAADYVEQFQYVCIRYTHENGETSYWYDAHGRQTGSGLAPESREYNEDGLLIRAGGTTYEYNDQGQKIRATTTYSSSVDIDEYRYNENGDVSWHRYTSDFNDEKMPNIVYEQTHTYEYENGRIIKDSVKTDGKLNWVYRYTYNADGWLLEVQCEYHDGHSSRDYQRESYTYDENGYLIKYVRTVGDTEKIIEYINGYIWAPEA